MVCSGVHSLFSIKLIWLILQVVAKTVSCAMCTVFLKSFLKSHLLCLHASAFHQKLASCIGHMWTIWTWSRCKCVSITAVILSPGLVRTRFALSTLCITPSNWHSLSQGSAKELFTIVPYPQISATPQCLHTPRAACHSPATAVPQETSELHKETPLLPLDFTKNILV